MTNECYERITIPDGSLLLTNHFMAVEAPNGTLKPADLDEYEQYMPIVQLMREVPRYENLNPLSEREVIRQLTLALRGEHPVLSIPLLGSGIFRKDMCEIVDTMAPDSILSLSRTLCLIKSDGLYEPGRRQYSFVNREELLDYLSAYADKETVLQVCEAAQKGKTFSSCLNSSEQETVRAVLSAFPPETVATLQKVRYLPSGIIAELEIKYAVMAAAYPEYQI